jgi:para-nitrobenzyl esterase
MAQHSLAPTYGYYFDRQLPGSDDGAYHACDIRYAFDTLDQCWRPFTDIDYRISRDMMDYFAYFVEHGEPAPAHLAAWEPLGKEQTKFLHFGDEPCAMVDVPEQRLAAWQAKGKPFPLRD